MTAFTRTLKKSAAWSLAALLIWQPAFPVLAEIAQTPTLLNVPPPVNIVFTLDDSGSMASETIPDSIYQENMWNRGTANDMRLSMLSTDNYWRYIRSAAGNPIYYDPKSRYEPWPNPVNDKVPLAAAMPAAACFLVTDGRTCSPLTAANSRNLAARVPSVAPVALDLGTEATGYWPATYYVYTGPAGMPYGNTGDARNIVANFQKVQIQPAVTIYTKHPDRADCTASPGICTYTEELQNFANWFQYYRTRSLFAKGAVALAFSKQGQVNDDIGKALRIGYASLGGATRTVDGFASTTMRLGVRPFINGATAATKYRETFFSTVYSTPTAGGTPLRKAMDEVGLYYQRSGVGNPWATDPTSATVGTEHTCRKSFHIMSTDGYWNGAAAGGVRDTTNQDTFSGVTPARPDGTTYPFSNTLPVNPLDPVFGVDPFRDPGTGPWTGTLADVAAYYWKTDLRPDLANRVPSSARDPAFWQHVSTFTVGLGIAGTLGINQTAIDLAIANRTPIAWPQPTANAATTGDDLIHAAVNGHGRYFLATNPNAFAADLSAAIREAGDQPVSSSDAEVSSDAVGPGGQVYLVSFSPAGWYGRLFAYNQDPVTGLIPTPQTASNAAWEASKVMPIPSVRNILTLDTSVLPAVGKNFLWPDLNAAQKGFLNNDPLLLDFLRGSDAKEARNGGTFRNRIRNTATGGVLGDIAGSSPIKGPNVGSGYDRLPSGRPGQSSYAAFGGVGQLAEQTRTLFAGANDGMLHGFFTGTGVERFAYVPNQLFNVPRTNSDGTALKKLAHLGDLAYDHKAYVDGPVNFGDAYVSGSWKTLTVSGLGAGSRGIYALDVTDPSAMNPAKAMWEFSEANDSDMGYVYGRLPIVALKNGQWGILANNGYDSVSKKAVLFILNAQDGTVIRKFELETTGGNGLSTPNFEVDAVTGEVLTVYAGDLKGNLWKVDVNHASPANWKVAFASNEPLFKAINSTGDAQPIFVQPDFYPHPQGGFVVLFGTGKFFEVEDTLSTPANVNLKQQSLYGIWDKPAQTAGITAARATALQMQGRVVAGPANFGGGTQNTVDWTTKRGWFFDLTAGTGERIYIKPKVFGQTVVFIPNTPVQDPCSAGGTSAEITVDAVTGRAPLFPVLDVDGDGLFNNNDTFVIGSGPTASRAAIIEKKYDKLSSAPQFQGIGGASSVPAADGRRALSVDRLDPNARLAAYAAGGLTGQGGASLGGNALTGNCTALTTIAQTQGATQSLRQGCVAGGGRVSWRQLR